MSSERINIIFEKIKKSGTKNSIEQFIYLMTEIGEVSECLRSLYLDKRPKKSKEDLFEEIGDVFMDLFLICKFENINPFDVIIKTVNKHYKKWENK